MSGIWREVRQAVRLMGKAPGFTAVVVLTLGLGIGATTAVFSIFHSVLLKPLGYAQPERIVMVFDTQPACKTCPASFPKYHDWKERNAVFSAIGGSTSWSYVLTGQGDPVRVEAVRTTASLVDVFGVQPNLGRWYTEQEDVDGGPKVAVLAHDFWQKQFNGDRGILGRKLILDGEPYEVIGVMPEGFTHRRGEMFIPLQQKLDPATRGTHFLSTYARVKDGITVQRATAEMRALGQQLAVEFGHNHGIDVRSYFEVIVGDVRTPLVVLLGAAGFLLLIASANVTNLLLASGLARRRELAIRLALGAGRRQLARQLAIEGVVLAAAGGVAGVLLAYWIVNAFTALAKDFLPRASTVALDGTALGFTAAVSVLVGVVCSLWPVALLCKDDLAMAVREGDLRTGTGAGQGIGNGLVVTEIALAFALFVGAGLLMKNLVLLQQRDAGVRTTGVVAFDVEPAGPRYAADEARVALYRELQQRLAQIGNVESVGFTSHLPMYRFGWNGEFQIEGGTPWGANEAPLVEYRWMYGDYLQTLGVPLVAGRLLDERDGKGTRTVLINKAMAEKFWPGKDPIGRRFGQGSDTSQWNEVVGVVGNIRSYGLTDVQPYEFFRTLEQNSFPNGMTAVLRVRGEDPTAVIPTARQMVREIDAALPITQVQTLEQVVADSVGQPRLMSALTLLFGGLAGLLAMAGVYSVMAYNVRRQRREFGIRLAVGASQADMRRLVFGRGFRLAAGGIVIGGLGAWMLSGLLRTMLNDVKPTDASVFAATAAAVALVALAASLLPAWSASRVDPIIVLRQE